MSGLSITHKLSTYGGSQLDMSESRQTSPHDQVARWRIISPREITTQLCGLELQRILKPKMICLFSFQ